jgi:hypothetical protein
MKRRDREYIYILFIVGLIGLNYPLMSIFNHLVLPLGIPLLYLYIFLVWLAIIVLLAVIMEKSRGDN